MICSTKSSDDKLWKCSDSVALVMSFNGTVMHTNCNFILKIDVSVQNEWHTIAEI